MSLKHFEVQPGHIASDLTNLLASRQFLYVDCYTITLKNGDVIRCTNAQRDLVVVPLGGGVRVTYSSQGPKISGVKLNVAVGMQVDEQDVQIDFLPTDTIQNKTYPWLFLFGRFDGAVITRDRYFAQTWGNGNTTTDWVGCTRMFSGKLSTIDEIGRSYVKFKVKSDLVYLNIQMPRALYQPSCIHTVYDAGCTLDRMTKQTLGTFGAGSTQRTIYWAGAAAVHQGGTFWVVSGAGVTMVRTIGAVVVGSSLTLNNPLEELPSIGTQFEVYEGCDRTLARCTVLNNTANHKAFPFTPIAETSF